MPEFQYTNVPGKIKPLLSKIREVGVPSKATNQWLKTIGFKSSNDGTLLKVLKFIGYIDSSGAPTAMWKDYRGKKHGQVLASAIREGYSDLYAVYPDAHSRTSSDLEHVFGTSSSAGKQVIGNTVRTFKNFCEAADFSASGTLKPPPPPSTSQDSSEQPPYVPSGGQPQPSLHIDIQVHISPDATTDQIDQIFSSMAKHLYKDKGAK